MVLVYSNRFGPATVFSLPDEPQAPPQYATIPEGPFPRANGVLAAKGRTLPWLEYAQQLEQARGHQEAWDVATVPDGTTLPRALSLLRDQASTGGSAHLDTADSEAQQPVT